MHPFFKIAQIIFAYAAIASTMLFSCVALNTEISPFFLIALRMSLGGVFLLLFSPFQKILTLKPLEWFEILFLSFLQIFLSFNCEAWALQYVPIAKAQLLYNLTPFLSALLICRQRNLSLLQWICIVLACMNSLFIPSSKGSFCTVSFPDIIMFLAVLSGATGWIYFKKLLQKGHSPHFLNGVTMLIGGLMSWALCFILNVPIEIKRPKEVFGSILFLLFISNLLFYGLYSRSLKDYSPTLLALLGQFTPCFSAIYAKIWFGMPFPDYFFWNVFLIIIATILFQREERRLWGRSDSN